MNDRDDYDLLSDEATILMTLLILCVVSVFIPHNDKKYNFSWHFRFLIIITLAYFISLFLYKIITI
jgi:hypothetical protein